MGFLPGTPCALEEKVHRDLSICASTFEVPSKPVLLAEKLFAEASGDSHGVFDVSQVRNQELSNSNAWTDRIGPVVAFGGKL